MFRRSIFFALCCALISLSVVPFPFTSSKSGLSFAAEPEVVPGELIIRYETDKNKGQSFEKAVYGALKSFGDDSLVSISPLSSDADLHRVKIANPKKLNEVLVRMKQQPGVAVAEPNYVLRALRQRTEPNPTNDPDFTKLWGMRNTGQPDPKGQVGKPGVDIGVVPIWNRGYTGSREIVVAIIDTGVNYNHVDLKANIHFNAAESGANATNGVDDDGNGYVDDYAGMDFSGDAPKPNGLDDHGHGSHCAGTIGGEGNNQTGVVGVNWKTSILPVKFLGADGSGSLAGAVEAINYATKMKVNIMSNSWGGGGFSQTLLDAIKKAKDAGILFVAAAGNDSNNNDAQPGYPASYKVENVLSVAAIDNQDRLAGFSNYGKTSVHIAAPGVNVWSTVLDNGYASYSGTSMATPHASGVAALLWSANPKFTYADIKERMIRTSVPVKALKNKVVANGRINVKNAFDNVTPPPGPQPDESRWKAKATKIESAHPYEAGKTVRFEVKQKGAKFLRIHFSSIDVESGYDFVRVLDASGEEFDSFSGKMQDVTSAFVIGDTAIIELSADTSVVGDGFLVDRIDVNE